jgi:hypothetical protein
MHASRSTISQQFKNALATSQWKPARSIAAGTDSIRIARIFRNDLQIYPCGNQTSQQLRSLPSVCPARSASAEEKNAASSIVLRYSALLLCS